MVQEASRRAHEYVASFPQASFLFLGVFTSHDGCAHNVVEQLKDLLKFKINLDTKLSGRTEYDGIDSLITPNFLH